MDLTSAELALLSCGGYSPSDISDILANVSGSRRGDLILLLKAIAAHIKTLGSA